MTPAARPDPAADLIAAFADPARRPMPVRVQYRPPAPVTEACFTDPDILDVARAICRVLDLAPAQLEPAPGDWGPAAGAPERERAAAQVRLNGCWVLDPSGRRVARVLGVTAPWLTIALNVLAGRGWRPDRQRSLA